MEPREQAKIAPYCLVTSMQECPFNDFWVVLLDCDGVGVEVYQSDNDGSLDEPNAWMRLRQFCKDNNYSIGNMAYGNKQLDPTRQINFSVDADGYFFSKRIRKLLSSNPRYAHYQDNAIGVGQLKDDMLTIHWIFDDGKREIEKRLLGSNGSSSEPISLIRK